MSFKKYTISLVSSLLLLVSHSAQACGFYESESDYRAMMFRVHLPSFVSFEPFNYTPSYYYQATPDLVSDNYQNDRYRNCAEWLEACQNKPSIDDIYTIQYKTDAVPFIEAYNDNTLGETFAGNTFIEYLTLKENKALLDYMLFAKRAELNEVEVNNRFEKWDSRYRYGSDDVNNEYSTPYRKLLDEANKKLSSSLSLFLKQRYAFQACRLNYHLQDPDTVISTFDKYFGKINKNSLMSVWAGLFRAMSTSSEDTDRYRFFTQVFNASDEKKFRSVQLFDNQFDQAQLTPQELSTATVMLALQNQGRALDQIRKAYELDKTNPYIPFLVSREINKLEDWMITPLFYKKYSYSNNDSFACAYYDEWLENYRAEQAKKAEEAKMAGDVSETEQTEPTDVDPNETYQKENLMTDMQYLGELKSFLATILPSAKGDTKDFYAISLAHLSLLQENTADAKKYMAMVADKANPSVLLQKKVETIWLATKTDDIHSDKFKKTFLENISDLERVSVPNFDNEKMMYTLILSLANEYFNKGDKVYGNLLRLKTNNLDADWRFYEDRGTDRYYYIEYFDNNSNINDLDKLITMLEKSKKTPFEEYLCNQKLGSVNAYKELKGTMAFRNNNLKLAYETFASMPQDYWQSESFYFKDYLNEDPFVPKGLMANTLRKFDYKFNKANFVKQIMQLQDEVTKDKAKSADCYNKLGDAYFNTSYWGNSWMMMRYGSSTGDTFYSKTECLPAWMRNYLTADMARGFYEKALAQAVNDEQRAYATIMLGYISDLNIDLKTREKTKVLAQQYRTKLKDYTSTKTYQQYASNCSMIRL